MADQQAQPITIAQAGSNEPLPTGLHDQMDGETLTLIPEDWEAPLQINMEGMTPEDLARDDRRAYCEHLLGDISSLFRSLREQAHVARARLWSDGQDGLPAAMETPSSESAEQARLHAIEAISNWYYRDGQQQKETVVYIGAISAKPQTINALHELNRLKHEFSGKLSDLRDALDPNSHTRGDMHDITAMLHENASTNLTRKAAGSLVRQLLHPKLNIRQLVRTIPIVDEFPYSVRWRWIDSPSTVKIERNKLLDMLERKQANPEAYLDFQRVATVSDPVFCLRKGQSNDLRISIRKSGLSGVAINSEGVVVRKDDNPYIDFKSRLPVFYVAAPTGYHRTEPKKLLVPDNAPKRKRKSRVEPEPFLTSMAVYRYTQK